MNREYTTSCAVGLVAAYVLMAYLDQPGTVIAFVLFGLFVFMLLGLALGFGIKNAPMSPPDPRLLTEEQMEQITAQMDTQLKEVETLINLRNSIVRARMKCFKRGFRGRFIRTGRGRKYHL